MNAGTFIGLCSGTACYHLVHVREPEDGAVLRPKAENANVAAKTESPLEPQMPDLCGNPGTDATFRTRSWGL